MNKAHPFREVGSVMVEFAGALILLVLLVFGISEIGRAIYQLNTLTKSVEAGARYLSHSVGAVSFSPGAPTSGEQCATNNTIWDPAVERATNIILYGTEDVGAATRLPDMAVTSISVTPRLDNSLGEGGACIIQISARARFASLFGEYIIPSFFNNGGGDSVYKGVVFSANAEERYQGE